VRFVLHGVVGPLSKLTFSVFVGTLQSLVPATPGLIGSAFLDHVYNAIDLDTTLAIPGTTAFEEAFLNQWAVNELTWWDHVLCSGIFRQHQVYDTELFIIKWGDDSGTGTGGTNQVVNSTYYHTGPLELWMWNWTSAVLSERRTRNLKELWTVLETLQCAAFLQSDCTTSPPYIIDFDMGVVSLIGEYSCT
jgi:hypothetical protein